MLLQTAPDYPRWDPVPQWGERPEPGAILSLLFGAVRPPQHVQRPSGGPMAEILTESFCERCGSRYTFESAVPRARLRGVRVLSRGLKNFVLDDKTSIDEAMAAARDDTDRALTAHQLEAFHKTFNFCMQCRQYICPNCWNDADGRCLTCAPLLGHSVQPSPFADVEPLLGVVPAHEEGLAAAAMNGHGHVADDPSTVDAIARLEALRLVTTAPSEPEMIGAEVEAMTDAAEARAAEATRAEAANDAFATAEAAAMAQPFEGVAETPAAEVEAGTPVTEAALPEAILVAESAQAVEALAEPDVSTAQVPGTEPGPDLITEPDAVEPVEAEAEGDAAAASGLADETADHVPSAGARASFLLAGLRPGESLDDAIAAFEAGPAAAADWEPAEMAPLAAETPTDVVVPMAAAQTPTEPEGTTPSEPVPSEPPVESPARPEPAWHTEPPVDDVAPFESIGAVAEGEPPAVGAAPEPGQAGVEAVPEPVSADAVVVEPVVVEPVVVEPDVVEPLVEPAAVEAAPEPTERAGADAAVDVVDQPTWSIVAPDARTPADVPGPFPDPTIDPPAPSVPAATQEPAWPPQPQWPSALPSSGLPFLGRPTVPSGGVDALWAELDLAVAAPPAGTGRPAGGVQPCVSCGLSLSASARFCRRCGTAQAG